LQRKRVRRSSLCLSQAIIDVTPGHLADVYRFCPRLFDRKRKRIVQTQPL
jgi:hypothetical protein